MSDMHTLNWYWHIFVDGENRVVGKIPTNPESRQVFTPQGNLFLNKRYMTLLKLTDHPLE